MSLPLPEEATRALEIARKLIDAGIPIFACPPIPGKPGEYQLPKHWEKTVPSVVNLEKWEPGWALAAVGGHVADFLDVDPRNGGNKSLADIVAIGHMPRSFGQQVTPSGGTHYLISPTGERKSTNFLPGLDLQAGAADGVGRGFVWIAPTVRRSKNIADIGMLRTYRWVAEPDVSALKEYAGCDDSIDGIVSRMRAKRSTPKQRQPAAANPDDPFMTTSDTFTHGPDRSFTLAGAQDFVRPHLIRLQCAQIGEIEENANTAAAVISHFVPEFWTVEEGMALLVNALGRTAYDPHGPSMWTVEKFRPVLDGRRPPLDNWKATRRAESVTEIAATTNTEEGESPTTVDRLRAMLVSASELAGRPAPEPLVYGLLDLDTEAWLIGAPGSLKSFIALDIAAHVGRGQEWQGHRVRKGRVLHIAAEGARGMVLRTRAWIKTHGDMEGVTFLPYPVQVRSADGQWAALVEIAREMRPDMIVIDTQARVTVGLEENSARDMGELIAAIGLLRRATGACILVIHHTGRSGGDARGSSAIDGAQDTELKVVRAEPRSTLECRLQTDKQKDLAEADDGLRLWMRIVDLGADEVTGRELSSLVVDGYDPWRVAQGSTASVDVDTEIWTRIPQPEEWTAALCGPKAKVRRRGLQVLADHGHTRGLTKAETLRIVIGRWEAPSKPSVWDAVWQELVALEGTVVNVGGERWAVDQVELNRLRAEH